MAGFQNTHNKGIRRQLLAAGVVFGGVLLLGGCSSVPDAINPAEWYKNTMDFFGGDDKEGQAARKPDEKDSQLKADRGKAPPGADKPFPTLAAVPSGLGADRSQRKYAQAPSRQGNAMNVLSEEPGDKKPAPAQIASAPPPPQAAPAPAVTRESPQAPKQTAQTPAANTMAPVRLRPPPPSTIAPTPSMTAPAAPKLTQPSGNQTAALPEPAPAPSLSYDPYATVVVSSGGMEMGAPAQAAEGMAAPTPNMPVMPTRSLAELAGSAPQMQAPNYTPVSAVSGQGLVKVATILFPNGSAQLSARDRRILGDVAQLQRESGGCPLVIVGHASSRTRDMNPVRHGNVNYRLSQNRANMVARSLRGMGISQRAIQVKAAGDTQPIYYEVMPSGEAGNRRADVYISY